MEIACDNRNVPGLKEGRITWIMNEMKIFGMEVTLQTAFRWYHGLARPRHKKLLTLAQILKVDDAWLSNGKLPEMDEVSKKHFNAAADGSVNITIGTFQLSGWNCAFPEEGDPNAHFVHFYSIIKGKQRRFHVALAFPMDSNECSFLVPVEHEKCDVIGVIRRKPTEIEFVLIPPEVTSALQDSSGGFVKVNAEMDRGAWKSSGIRMPVIKDFAKTLAA